MGVGGEGAVEEVAVGGRVGGLTVLHASFHAAAANAGDNHI